MYIHIHVYTYIYIYIYIYICIFRATSDLRRRAKQTSPSRVVKACSPTKPPPLECTVCVHTIHICVYHDYHYHHCHDNTYIYIYIYIHVHICVYVYNYLSLYLSLYIHIYIYIYIHTHTRIWPFRRCVTLDSSSPLHICGTAELRRCMMASGRFEEIN